MDSNKQDLYRQIRGRMYDLISDLEMNESTKVHAINIRSALKDVKTNRIIKVLRDTDSALSKAIPEDLLKTHVNGAAYVEILDMVRKDSPKKQVAGGQINSIESLVESITSELGLGEGESFDPSNMGNLLERISSSVMAKQQAGLLDEQTLERDAQAFLGAFQDSPMFKQLLNNPEMQSIIASAQNVDTSTEDKLE